MTINKFTSGVNTSFSSELNSNFVESANISGLNLIRQLIDRAGVWSAGMIDWWGDAYIDSNGRENSVDTGSDTSAEFDTDKYKIPDVGTEYVIIEADDASINWTSNNTKLVKISSGKWLLYGTTGTDAVKRAQIHKSLWYGTNGTDQLILDFTNVTAVKTSHTNDVGKRAHYAKISAGALSASGSYTGTFANTSTNTDCASWSNLTMTDNNYDSYWEIPDGTVRHQISNGSSDELGTDLSADENDNPADCQLLFSGTGGGESADNRAIVLCAGDISWASAGAGSVSNIDFYTTHSIPDMTAAGSLSTESVVYIVEHTIPTGTFSTTISSAVGVPFIEDWETGADIDYKLTNATEDSGWLNYNEVSSFTAFTSEPTTLIVKLIPKTSSPTTGYPSVKGFAVRAA